MQTVADIEGPLKQRIAKLERENAKLREACEKIVAAELIRELYHGGETYYGMNQRIKEVARAAIDTSMKGERT